MNGGSTTLFDLVLSLEVRAARVEAALEAVPQLAQQWRAEVGIAEAVATIGLEDVRLAETDLLHRIFENGKERVDARAAEDALAVIRFLRSPGGRSDRGAGVIDRILQIARPAGDDTDQSPRSDEFDDVFADCVGRSPILEAVRAAGRFALLTGRQNPLAERLVFMAAEHLSRDGGGGRGRSMRTDDPYRGLGGRYDAGWIAAPSLALTYQRFRIWSPLNPVHIRGLLEGMDAQLGRELGRLAEIRGWIERANAVGQGAHGRSRLADAIAAFALEPVMGGARLADRIGITPRGALNLLDDLSGRGILVELTRRRAARVWSTPGVARLLMATVNAGASSPTSQPPARRGTGVATDGPTATLSIAAATTTTRPSWEEEEASMAEAMAEFDRALEEADRILERLNERRS